MAAEDDPVPDSVRVSGADRFDLPVSAAPPGFDLRTGRYDVVCSSGDRETGEWRGVPVGALLDRAGPAVGATHLVVTGADGYRVCVPIAAALDGLLATERLDAPHDGSVPRFLAPGVGGTRSVKAVRRLEPVTLAPGEDAEAYEDLRLDDRG